MTFRPSFKFDSMFTAVTVAILLIVVVLIFPMRTSLGQGVDEYVVKDWRGVFDPLTHSYSVRIDYVDGTFQQAPMNALPTGLFSRQLDRETWVTPVDSVQVLAAAHAGNPQGLAKLLGTSRNVPGIMRPFAQAPVAYSAPFLQKLAQLNINPGAYGGPNIPPGSVPITKLPSLILQIDTAADGNTLRQCQPGETPPQLAQLTAAAG